MEIRNQELERMRKNLGKINQIPIKIYENGRYEGDLINNKRKGKGVMY